VVAMMVVVERIGRLATSEDKNTTPDLH